MEVKCNKCGVEYTIDWQIKNCMKCGNKIKLTKIQVIELKRLEKMYKNYERTSATE